MAAAIVSDRDLEFMLFELFDALKMTERERYQDHNKETFLAALDTAKAVSEKYFVPIRQKVDQNEPTFDGEKVHLIPEIKTAINAVFEAGLAAPTTDYEVGGMQLPQTVASAVSAYLSAAASTTMGYVWLTHANCNLLEHYGSPEQIEKWVMPMREGRFAGTMALTEPGAGSGLADLTTSAVPQEDGSYLITGNKIFISGGDHPLNENIVHLVLARIKGAPKGIKGISLFIVPKYKVDENGVVGESNDVNLAGLWHKMGGRGHTSTALSFGEKGGAQGFLVGEAHKGLSYMFHMMNEARVLVGTGAAITALTGYQYSLYYAKERPQGRLLSSKDPFSPPVNIVEHPDVKRMLLAQKAYSEGAYALCLFGSQLADDIKTAPTEDERKQAHELLDFLTPIIKTWPSEYGPKANDLAIQVLGGHGYVNEHPVEMFYRDNRLNPIHEGTTGIQSLDLLARKVPQNNFAGYKLMLAEMSKTLDEAGQFSELQAYATQLQEAIAKVQSVTQAVLSQATKQNPDLVFANSVHYLSMFGHVCIAWIWLKQAIVAQTKLGQQPHEADNAFYRGKLQAMRYFYATELPQINVWGDLVSNLDSTCFDMQVDWF